LSEGKNPPSCAATARIHTGTSPPVCPPTRGPSQSIVTVIRLQPVNQMARSDAASIYNCSRLYTSLALRMDTTVWCTSNNHQRPRPSMHQLSMEQPLPAVLYHTLSYDGVSSPVKRHPRKVPNSPQRRPAGKGSRTRLDEASTMGNARNPLGIERWHILFSSRCRVRFPAADTRAFP
jgi:hypothetical protein